MSGAIQRLPPAEPREADVEVGVSTALGYRVGDRVGCSWFGEDVVVTVTRITAGVMRLREVS